MYPHGLSAINHSICVLCEGSKKWCKIFSPTIHMWSTTITHISPFSEKKKDIKSHPEVTFQVVKKSRCKTGEFRWSYTADLASIGRKQLSRLLYFCVHWWFACSEKCIITCEVTERTSSHNSYRPRHQESGNSPNIVLPPALYSSSHKMILWRDFSYRRFGSVWFTHMFTDVFQMVPLAGYCLPLLVPRWITSGQIEACLWGFDIYWGYASLWTSPLASQCTREKQMVRSWHVWTLKHLGFMVLFMLFCTFGLHLVQRLWQASFCPSACWIYIVIMLFWTSVRYLDPSCSVRPLNRDLLTPAKSLTWSWWYTVSKYMALWPCSACCLLYLGRNSSYQSNWLYFSLYCSFF